MLIDTVLGPRNHMFFDSSVYHEDDELRKEVEKMSTKICVTAQEAVENHSKKMRSDLYKKHITGKKLRARLPHTRS